MVIDIYELFQNNIKVKCIQYVFITTNHANFTIFHAKLGVLSKDTYF